MASVGIENLNPAQRDAVLAPNGAILIVAGAGSGKTRVLTRRIAYLISERGFDPGQMLAVTFTNKAASEMKERVASLLGPGVRLPWVSTFHSACARILRQEIGSLGYQSNFTIFDEADSLSALRRSIESVGLDQFVTPESARASIDQAKNDALDPADYARRASSASELKVADIYRIYQARLTELNALDFGDLLLLTFQLFDRHPEVLLRWQDRACHLLVDEYQDTNRVQYLLLKALSARSGNLFVVGDEDQSIYRWRGADIRNILDFENDFPNTLVFKLEQNYRSTKTILAAADSVIQNNRQRKPKSLWTTNDPGEPVTYYTGTTERDEADYIAREIARLNSQAQVPHSEVVIFYRTNGQSRVLEEALVRRRVPYAVVGGVRFYERKEVKDLLAYLRVLANPADEISLERLITVPPRGVGAKTIESLREFAAREGIKLFEAMARAESASSIALRISKQVSNLYGWLGALLERVKETTVRALLDEVVARTSFSAYLDAMQDAQNAEDRRQNVRELLSAAASFDAEYGAGGLDQFLERVALVSDADQLALTGGRVTLMTLHTSKGLEYPVVFIAGMEEGLFPHSRSQDSGAEVEEERRLCYVGMTRARRLLYLTNTVSREIYGLRQESRPSRFLSEIDPQLIQRFSPPTGPTGFSMPARGGPAEPYVDYSDSQVAADDDLPHGIGVGAKVMHPTFGEGVVRKCEGRGDSAKAWIHFNRSGVKLLVLKFAHLRPIAR
jgi:DNA helicase-2/ATP-dependent DNA helicase PcrA